MTDVMVQMKKLLYLLQIIILGFLLYWRFQLGIHRYFDIDEYAHLHWTYNFFSGFMPYRDFLYFFPPGFLFFLLPVFAVVGKSYVVLTAARVFMFLVFLLLLASVFLLVKQVRSVRVAILTLVILSFLPLPYDKFLEVRPDTIATVFSILGIYCFAKGMEKNKWWYVLSGISYGLAVGTLPKVAFFLVSFAITVLFFRPKPFIKPFLMGFFVPIAGALVFLGSTGAFAKALYLTTVFSSESTKVLAAKFPMHASLFFYPNNTYYGELGWNLPLFINLSFYVIAVLWAIIRLVSFLDYPTKKESVMHFLIATTFLLNFFAYAYFFPLKHAQYMILFAPFVAFYAADFIYRFKPAKGTKRNLAFFSLLSVFLGVIAWKGYAMYRIKSQWTNEKTFQDMAAVSSLIPADSYVFDLFGQTIFYRDPYYVCCIPYGQYVEVFGPLLPSLPHALEKSNTRFVFLSEKERLNVLPSYDANYIADHYKILTPDPLILVRK